MSEKDMLTQQLLLSAFRFNFSYMYAFSEASKLSRSEFITLYVIKIKGGEKGIKLGDLAHYLGHAAPSVTQRVNSLEKSGYAQRVRDTDDKRIYYVKITENGEKIIAESGASVMKNVQSVVDGIGVEKTKDVIESLDKISAMLCDDSNSNADCRMPQIWREKI